MRVARTWYEERTPPVFSISRDFSKSTPIDPKGEPCKALINHERWVFKKKIARRVERSLGPHLIMLIIFSVNIVNSGEELRYLLLK